MFMTSPAEGLVSPVAGSGISPLHLEALQRATARAQAARAQAARVAAVAAEDRWLGQVLAGLEDADSDEEENRSVTAASPQAYSVGRAGVGSSGAARRPHG